MMCARLLRHTPDGEAGPLLSRARQRLFDRRHRALRHACCAGCCDRQTRDAAGRGGDARADGRSSTSIVPKGFFPVQDTGVIQGISEAPQIGLVRGDGGAPAGAGARSCCRTRRSRACRRSSASTAPTSTLNSGRILINLKPLDERDVDATDVIRRLQPQLAEVRGHHALHAAGAGPHRRGPRQPHAVPVQPRSRRRRGAAATGRRGWSSACGRCRSSATSRATSRPAACELTLDDRPRHRVAPRHHAADDRQRALQRLRPAPGLDHLHPAEPVPRGARGGARVPAAARRRSSTSTSRSASGAAGAARAVHARSSRARRAAAINHQGQFPAVTISFNLAPGVSLGDAVDAIDARGRRARPAGRACAPSFQGAALAFQASLANQPLLILAALVTVYIVLGVLYESYIHPVTILSTLPSAGVGALLALLLSGSELERHRAHRHHPADRHRQEERDHDDRLRARGRAQAKASRRARRSTRRACCASGRS